MVEQEGIVEEEKGLRDDDVVMGCGYRRGTWPGTARASR